MCTPADRITHTTAFVLLQHLGGTDRNEKWLNGSNMMGQSDDPYSIIQFS